MPVTIGGSGPITGVTSINTSVSDTELSYLDGVSSALQTQINSKLNIAGGKILQVVSATDSSERSTTSTTFVDCGTLSLNITPSATSSKIVIFTSIPARVEISGQPNGFFQIANGLDTGINGAVEIPIGVASGFTTSGTARFDAFVGMVGFDSPNSTSQQTYKVRFRSSTGVLTLARMSGRTGVIAAMEVSG